MENDNQETPGRTPLKEKALDLLSYRRLSRRELRDKLLFKHYEAAEIEALLDRYVELGLLNDESLAQDFARRRIEVKPMSRRLLRLEMLNRRLPENIVEQTLEKIFQTVSEEELANKAIEAILNRVNLRSRVWNRLTRLGFPHDLIERLVAAHSERIEDDGRY